jgi:hypothetical protein
VSITLYRFDEATSHPVGRLTRPTLDALYGRRTGSFGGKTMSVAGEHPVGVLTRMDLMGLYTQRAGPFSGKTPEVVEPIERLQAWRGAFNVWHRSSS